jgi:molybdenum cofactor cytidylyltransferase
MFALLQESPVLRRFGSPDKEHHVADRAKDRRRFPSRAHRASVVKMTPVEKPARLFAVVPAAGQSRRMGRPKLLLPLGTSTVIAKMLSALARPEIAATIVVVRPDDEPLRAAVAESGATPLQPTVPPPEMRQSVEHALRHIEARFHPRADEGWLLAPADHPLLDPEVITRMIAEWSRSAGKILVPVYRGRRGHPALFPFSLAAEVFKLPADRGLNSLLKVHATEIVQIDTDSPAVVVDLDTPEDYARLLGGMDRDASS